MIEHTGEQAREPEQQSADYEAARKVLLVVQGEMYDHNKILVIMNAIALHAAHCREAEQRELADAVSWVRLHPRRTAVSETERLNQLEKLVGELNLVALSDRSDGGKLNIIRALLRADIIDSQAAAPKQEEPSPQLTPKQKAQPSED